MTLLRDSKLKGFVMKVILYKSIILLSIGNILLYSKKYMQNSIDAEQKVIILQKHSVSDSTQYKVDSNKGSNIFDLIYNIKRSHYSFSSKIHIHNMINNSKFFSHKSTSEKYLTSATICNEAQS